MTIPEYDKALALADDDPDTLDAVHLILKETGLTEATYAHVFELLFYKSLPEDERITYSEVEKVWKRGDEPISDIKLFAVLNQCFDLVRAYALYSWENCVFSAWVSKKEVTKAEKEISTMESLPHAKSILLLAAPLMPDKIPKSKIKWTEDDTPESSEK